jgi:hypothetical protein
MKQIENVVAGGSEEVDGELDFWCTKPIPSARTLVTMIQRHRSAHTGSRGFIMAAPPWAQAAAWWMCQA